MKSSCVKTTRFWLAWIFASLLVYPLTFIYLFAISIVLSTVARVFFVDVDMFFASHPVMDFVFILGIVSGLGGIVGISIGGLQNYVIRRYFHFELTHWKRATIIGGMIAAPVMAFVLNELTTYMSDNYWYLIESGQFEVYNSLTNMLPMILYVLVLSTVQLVILRQYVKNAWLWILANTVAGFMFSMLMANAFNPGFGDWLLAAIAQGAVTGFAMLWLLHRLNREEEAAEEREYAFQHVPIESDDTD